MRGERPFVFTNLKSGEGLEDVVRFIVDAGMLQELPDAGGREATN
jgi:urease accessory protein